MKKKVVVLTLITAMLLVAGCKKTTTEDIYGDQTTTEEPAVSEQVAESGEEAQEEADASEEELSEETVAEDVYDHTATEEVDASDVEVVSSNGVVTDPIFEKQLVNFLDPVVFNILTGQESFDEGFTEDDMVRFAVSYVYQYEYNELKFDTEEFKLYVPEKHVEEIVEKYFDTSVTRHHSFEDYGVVYKDGDYIVDPVGDSWDVEMYLSKVVKTGDFSYEALVEMRDEVENELGELDPSHYHLASLEVRDGRFILTGYKNAESDGLSEVEAEDDTSDETITDSSDEESEE